MLELLSPAGSPQAVVAAVQNGADAVYLGYGDFNARRNAKNFTREELQEAVNYCHQRGSRVFLTLNTLLTDRELPNAALLAAEVSSMGVDAAIVQDMGVARMLRQTVPDLPIHGSTQMTIHSLDGVKKCADLGMERVVLSRELSRDQLEYICANSPIQIETFVHGALCMCYSGQCYFSSVLGGRSGNRGLCAQPCRLQYGWGKRADSYPLSPKDMSLAGHLKELRQLGISCLKIEGRMKRPEYVAIVTGIYARALRENREPTAEELRQLEEAFSRQGFTDDYFQGKKGPQMFGVRQEEKPPQELYALARQSYESGEARKNPITFFVQIEADSPIRVAVRDEENRIVSVEGDIPQEAVNVPITAEKVEGQLSRTGGTPYTCKKVVAKVDDGLSVPLSALNALRREVLDLLSKERILLPQRRTNEFNPGVRYQEPKTAPALTLSLSRVEQLTPALLATAPHRIYLPAEVITPAILTQCQEAQVPLAATLPRICNDRESAVLRTHLESLKEAGLDQVLAGNLGTAHLAQELGLVVHGDFGLGVFNSQSIKELKRLGFQSATPSFELKLAQIRDLNKAVPLEMIAYGRLPLMITENCIIQNRTDGCQKNCEGENLLTDRRGEKFPVVKAPGCRNEILNGKTLFLADKQRDYQRLGLASIRLLFTTETADQCVQVTKRYQGEGRYAPRDLTRGLYYRDVE